MAQVDSLGQHAAQIPQLLSRGAVKPHLSLPVLCINNKTLPPSCRTKPLQGRWQGSVWRGLNTAIFPLTEEPWPAGRGGVLRWLMTSNLQIQ